MQATIKEEWELHKNPFENIETEQNKQCVTRLLSEDAVIELNETGTQAFCPV